MYKLWNWTLVEIYCFSISKNVQFFELTRNQTFQILIFISHFSNTKFREDRANKPIKFSLFRTERVYFPKKKLLEKMGIELYYACKDGKLGVVVELLKDEKIDINEKVIFFLIFILLGCKYSSFYEYFIQFSFF